MKKIVTLFLVVLGLHTLKSQNTFLGACGYGTTSKGAYQGSANPTILYVDTLSGDNFSTSANSGTLKWCLSRSYPRIILFKVGGLIDWSSNSSDPTGGIRNAFTVSSPYCNIYGQTAPSPGITIINGGLLLVANHDILIQHLRFRVGDGPATAGKEAGNILMWSGNYNIVIDHCSFSWSIDQLVGFNPAHDITLSNNLFGEPLNHNTHPNPGDEYHAMFNTILRSQRVTIIKNLYAHGLARAPFFNSGIQDVYVANNLMYNVQNYAAILYDEYNLDSLTRMSVISNWYKPGSGTQLATGYLVLIKSNVPSGANLYINGNYSSRSSTQDGMVKNESTCTVQSTTPMVNAMGFIPMKVDTVPKYLYKYSGAYYWNRDSTDLRIIKSVKDSTGRIIDFTSEVNTYLSNVPSTKYFLSIPVNPNSDDDSDGWTNLQEWVAAIADTQTSVAPPFLRIKTVKGRFLTNSTKTRFRYF